MSRENPVLPTVQLTRSLVLVDIDALIIFKQKELVNGGETVECHINKELYDIVEQVRVEEKTNYEDVIFVLFTKEKNIQGDHFIKSAPYETGRYQDTLNVNDLYTHVQEAFHNIFESDIQLCKENADGTIILDIDEVLKEHKIDRQRVLVVSKDIHLSAQQNQWGCRVVTSFSAGQIDAADLARFQECIGQDCKANEGKRGQIAFTGFVDVDDTLFMRFLTLLSGKTNVNVGLLDQLEAFQRAHPSATFELLTARADISARNREQLSEFSEFKQIAAAQKEHKALSDAYQKVLHEMEGACNSILLTNGEQKIGPVRTALTVELDIIDKHWRQLLTVVTAKIAVEGMIKRIAEWKNCAPFYTRSILQACKRIKPHLVIKEVKQSYVDSARTKKNKALAIEKRIMMGLKGVIVLFDNSVGELSLLRKRFPKFSEKIKVLGVRVYEDGNFADAGIKVMKDFLQESVQLAACKQDEVAAAAVVKGEDRLPLFEAMRQMRLRDGKEMESTKTFDHAAVADQATPLGTRTTTPFEGTLELPSQLIDMSGQLDAQQRAVRCMVQQVDEVASSTTYVEEYSVAPSVDGEVTPKARSAVAQQNIPELVLGGAADAKDKKSEGVSLLGVGIFSERKPVAVKQVAALGVAAAAAVAIASLGSS